MSFTVAADAYDRFMGRYSTQLVAPMIELGGVEPGQSALDVGCGPGALTAGLVDRLGADAVSAVDPSEPFVAANRQRHPGVDVRRAGAEELPFPDGRFDVALAQLVVHFMTDPVAGFGEMAPCRASGRQVAACVWDHAGERSPLAVFWNVAAGPRPGRAGRAWPERCSPRVTSPSCSSAPASTASSNRCCPPRSSTPASRSGGSRTPSASGRPARTSPHSTRPGRDPPGRLPRRARAGPVHRVGVRLGRRRHDARRLTVDVATSPTVRPATADDAPFLATMLAVAADWRPGTEVRPVDEIMAIPALAHYVAGWPAPDDHGLVAEGTDRVGGRRQVGAAW